MTIALVGGLLLATGSPVARSKEAVRALRNAHQVSSQSVPTYWLVAADGGVFSFGGLPFYGSMGGKPLNEPVVGMTPTPDHQGYWEVASDGGIFSFGDARFHGSMGGKPLNAPMVGMATTPDGGYWEVASDGGIFSFGAPFYGSMGGHHLNAPVVGMASTPDGRGYWLVAADGGIFSFGDASFLGSMGGKPLNAPVVSMTATAQGTGYWLVAADGGIFTFGAPFLGSLGSDPLSRPIVGMTSTGQPNNGGYWMTDSNGAVSPFGDAGYYGSAPQQLNAPVVGMADGPGTGAGGETDYPHGAFGYDVSNYQCGQGLPGHTIGVVQTNGWSKGAPNPCLQSEAAWAGGGLNLYTFLSFGADGTPQPGCTNVWCNFGYEAGVYAFDYASSQLVDTSVGWWLDVEPSNWSPNGVENDQVINGALIALRSRGINSVGVYTSAGTWSEIAGTWQPAIPLWVAWWGPTPEFTCSNVKDDYPGLPTGPVVLVQYTDNGGSIDGDYAC
ncbi:MAG TPA: hypothetical protein VEJ87_03905 [Acidimicrobiales bacterium]|nr:hypothetical protein [Acidimicrobiales bacterium]